ncbi:MAG: DNA cytosine methyltransferase [Chloroflexota bacterium]
MNNTYTFVDLFCGAGGLSLGFANAGFQCVQAIDHDKSAVATHNTNFKEKAVLAEITEQTDVEMTDVIVGGPPCQGFSSAGLRRSADERNTLVSVFAELIVQKQPQAFIFENVEGFLTTDKGNRVFDLLEPLIETGYRIHLQKINAANYSVPQHRKRVVAIGGLGWNPTFPEPISTAYGAPGASNAGSHLPRCPSLADALAYLPQPQSGPPGTPCGHFTRPVSDLDQERMKLLQPGQTMRDLPESLWHESYRRRANRRVKDGTPTEKRGGAPAGLRRLYATDPCKAITSGALSEFVHPTEDRYLTIRECARIQTFPDDFCFEGTQNQMVRQIGNAVPPRLAEIIASHLKSDLDSLESKPNFSEGALLSFVPTTSTGMSPVLQSLSNKIEEKYLYSEQAQMEQLSLWP